MRHINYKPHPMIRRSATKRNNSISNSPTKKKHSKMSAVVFEEQQQQQQSIQLEPLPKNNDLPSPTPNDDSVTQDHAIVMTAVQGATSMDYVKAVAAIIGSNAIHGVFEDSRGVKVYLKQKKHVQMVIHQGVQVKGRQMNVDFLVPPATKVVLSQVDPIIPDKSLLCLLGCFGSFESTLIRQRISDEEGYSHIESSSRVLYMKIDEDKSIPLKLPLVHDNCLHEITVTVEGPPKMFRFCSSQTEA